MSTRHKHKFQRLSDEALFCECGKVKDVRPQPVHYCSHWCNHWHYPHIYPTWIWPGDTISTGGTTTGKVITSGSITYADDTSLTIT